MPWWNPFGWWAYVGWYPVTALGLILTGAWYVLDWVAPPNTARRRFIDRFICIG